MRVGLVIRGSIDTATGGYRYDRMLAERLAAHGDDVEVVALAPRGYGRELCDVRAAALARRLASRHFDVLLEDELSHACLGRANRRLRAGGGCPIVAIVHVLRATEHGDSPLAPLYAATERRYLATVDGAVYPSRATRDATAALAGPRLAGVVAHPGADHLGPCATPAALGRRTRRDGPLRIVCVANVVRAKRVDVLVRALALLPRDAWRLTVVGSLTVDRARAERLRRLVERLGLADRVRFAGAVAPAAVASYLDDADLLVGMSTYESLGIAYLEAMRRGLPVVATAAGGAGEILEHGREGLIVTPGDPGALATELRRLAGDRELLERMALAAARRAAGHPTWERSLARVRRYLQELVADAGARREPEAA